MRKVVTTKTLSDAGWRSFYMPTQGSRNQHSVPQSVKMWSPPIGGWFGPFRDAVRHFLKLQKYAEAYIGGTLLHCVPNNNPNADPILVKTMIPYTTSRHIRLRHWAEYFQHYIPEGLHMINMEEIKV